MQELRGLALLSWTLAGGGGGGAASASPELTLTGSLRAQALTAAFPPARSPRPSARCDLLRLANPSLHPLPSPGGALGLLAASPRRVRRGKTRPHIDTPFLRLPPVSPELLLAAPPGCRPVQVLPPWGLPAGFPALPTFSSAPSSSPMFSRFPIRIFLFQIPTEPAPTSREVPCFFWALPLLITPSHPRFSLQGFHCPQVLSSGATMISWTCSSVIQRPSWIYLSLLIIH